MPLVEPVTIAALPLSMTGLPFEFPLDCRVALGGFAEAVEGDLAVTEGEVGEDVLARHDLAHRQPCNVGADVAEQLQVGREVPGLLDLNVLESIAHQLAD